MRRMVCWSRMTTDVFKTVNNFHYCPLNGVETAQTWHLKLFLASSTSEIIIIDIHGPLPKKIGNQFVEFMADHYSQLTRAVPAFNTMAFYVVSIFLDQRVVPCRITTYLLTYNGTQIVSRLLDKTPHNRGISPPPTNGQAERYNRALVVGLCYHVAKYHGD